jgi:SAM-dependent methyltransferase
MPVNFLHSLFHRVELGWDPILSTYAEEYERHALKHVDTSLVERVEALSGELTGKRVLDLGGGPGQFSVLFAKRGARVTWHDISREYQKIAKGHAEAQGVLLDFSLGYLEEAKKFGKESFDVVFCRVCWYYCRSDRAFARLIYSLLKPGGVGYVECNTPAFANLKGWGKLQSWLNEWGWWKIGHPLPPHGRIAKLVQKYPLERLALDYSSKLVDAVFFVKKGTQPEQAWELCSVRPGTSGGA